MELGLIFTKTRLEVSLIVSGIIAGFGFLTAAVQYVTSQTIQTYSYTTIGPLANGTTITIAKTFSTPNPADIILCEFMIAETLLFILAVNLFIFGAGWGSYADE